MAENGIAGLRGGQSRTPRLPFGRMNPANDPDPHAISDEVLQKGMETIGKMAEDPRTFNPTHTANMVLTVQNEMQRRATYAMRDAINEFRTASEKSAKRIEGITRVLVVLTAALVALTITLIITT